MPSKTELLMFFICPRLFRIRVVHQGCINRATVGENMDTRRLLFHRCFSNLLNSKAGEWRACRDFPCAPSRTF